MQTTRRSLLGGALAFAGAAVTGATQVDNQLSANVISLVGDMLMDGVSGAIEEQIRALLYHWPDARRPRVARPRSLSNGLTTSPPRPMGAPQARARPTHRRSPAPAARHAAPLPTH